VRAEEARVRCTGEIWPDPKDDPFCFCSEQREADFIVTLKLKDFPEGRLEATVVRPSHFAA